MLFSTSLKIPTIFFCINWNINMFHELSASQVFLSPTTSNWIRVNLNLSKFWCVQCSIWFLRSEMRPDKKKTRTKLQEITPEKLNDQLIAKYAYLYAKPSRKEVWIRFLLFVSFSSNLIVFHFKLTAHGYSNSFWDAKFHWKQNGGNKWKHFGW